LGEQIVRAAAPNGGVVCGSTQVPPGEAAPGPHAKTPTPLAYTNAAYRTIPIFWTGTALLLAGVVIVSAMPLRPRRGGRLGGPDTPQPPGDSQADGA
jgi:hypothetical protein